MRHTTTPTAVAKTLILLTLLALALTQTPATAQGQGVQVFIPVATLKNVTIAGNDTVAPHLYDWSFDGVDDYVQIGSVTTVFPRTVSVRFSNANQSSIRYIIVKSYYENMETNALFDKPLPNKLLLYYWNGSSTQYIGSSSTLFKPDTFYTISAVYDPAGSSLYVNSALDASFPATPNMTYHPQAQYRLGARYPDSVPPFQGYISFFIIHEKRLSISEVSALHNNYIVNASNMKLFLDATFYDGTKYIDLSGNNNHGIPYNGVQRVPANQTWLWLVKNLTSDSMVHLRFFPPGKVVRFTSVVTGARYEFVIGGSPNQAGLVDDVAVSLPAGVYNVEYGHYVQYVPYTISVYTSSQFYLPGERAYIYFVARDNYGGFVSGLNVAGTLVFPNGTSVSIVFSEDSVNQRYVYVFNDTTAVGVYLVNASTVIYGVPGYATAGFRVLPLDYPTLISMVNATSLWVRKMGIDIPSVADVAVVDGVLTGLLSIAMVVVISYCYRNRRYYMMLLFASIAVLTFSFVLMSARSIVPTGFKVVYTEDNATRIEYIYGANRFAMLYMVPTGLALLGFAVFVLLYIQQSAKSSMRWGRSVRWGR